VKSYERYDRGRTQPCHTAWKRLLQIQSNHSLRTGHLWQRHCLLFVSLVLEFRCEKLTMDNRVTATLPVTIGLISYSLRAGAALSRTCVPGSTLGVFL
jgi:hypothetical protein